MPYHFESNVGPNNKEYTEGGAAYHNKEERKAPFEDQQSPEAMDWYKGFDNAEEAKLKEIQRQEEIAELERLYKL